MIEGEERERARGEENRAEEATAGAKKLMRKNTQSGVKDRKFR